MSDSEKVNEKLDKNLVFINRSVCFPEPKIKNTANSFGLKEDDVPKDVVSLGTFKVFPPSVWETVFLDYKACPLAQLKGIRAQLQRFIDNHTFPYIDKAARALPVVKLVSFMETVDGLRKKFDDERERYVLHLPQLLDASETYWKEAGPEIFTLKSDELADLIRDKFDDVNAFRRKFKFEVIPLKITSIDAGTVEVADIVQREDIQKAHDKMVGISQTLMDEKTDQFKTDIIVELRDKVTIVVHEFHEKVKSGKCNKTAFTTVQKAAKNFTELNFMEDTGIQKLTQELISTCEVFDASVLKKNPARLGELEDIVEGWIATLSGPDLESPEHIVHRFINGKSKEELAAPAPPTEIAEPVAVAEPVSDEVLISQAIDILIETERCSLTAFQRRLKISLTRASELMDLLEQRGLVGPPSPDGARNITMDLEDDPF